MLWVGVTVVLLGTISGAFIGARIYRSSYNNVLYHWWAEQRFLESSFALRRAAASKNNEPEPNFCNELVNSNLDLHGSFLNTHSDAIGSFASFRYSFWGRLYSPLQNMNVLNRRNSIARLSGALGGFLLTLLVLLFLVWLEVIPPLL